VLAHDAKPATMRDIDVIDIGKCAHHEMSRALV
jgi:hypothetical protein